MVKKKFKPTVIGRKVKVTMSKNRYNNGIEGIAIDETRNMVILDTEKGVKMLIKKENNFEIDGRFVEGNALTGRPEERVKQ